MRGIEGSGYAWAAGALGTLVVVLAGYLTALLLMGPSVWHRDEVVIVPCPSEDSCTVDYYDGAWHIGPPGSAR